MEETMSDDAILYEKDGPVARVILNRPERRNALTDPMFTQIVECYHRAEQDDDVKVIELMGKGDTFCVGFDLRDPDLFYEGADVGENNVRDGIYALRFRTEVMRDMMFVLKPTIARVHRHCIGAGLFLTLVADFAIASDNTVFGFPESRYGDAGGVWCFPFVVMQCGLKRARELLMTGRKFTAEEAERFNFINHSVPMDKLDDEVNELIHALCSLPRDSLAFSKSFQHEIYGTLGVPSFFLPHYTIHPLALQIKRKQDEFDFRETVREKGLKGGIEERNKRFSGRYWNW
jgi:enoyl-CoA hydratase